MQRVGDDNAGFSVSVEPTANTVSVSAWGFWNVEVATAFGGTVKEACRNRTAGATLTIDMSDLKPMRDEGQQSFVSVVSSLAALRFARVVITTSSQLTKLQLLRLAAQAGARDLVQFAEADKTLGRRTA